VRVIEAAKPLQNTDWYQAVMLITAVLGAVVGIASLIVAARKRAPAAKQRRSRIPIVIAVIATIVAVAAVTAWLNQAGQISLGCHLTSNGCSPSH
jgi:formate-dependent nitrite reductase membrane component NrfD